MVAANTPNARVLTAADLAARWQLSRKSASAKIALIPGAFQLPGGSHWRVTLQAVESYESGRDVVYEKLTVPIAPRIVRIPLTPAERSKRHRATHPDRAKARAKLGSALRVGSVKRQSCRRCGSPNAQAHHTDYAKPLDVEWLCRKCHRQEHRSARP
jgi:ribosomal protein S27AE